MHPNAEIIKQELKRLDYITISSPIKTWFGGKIVGFNVSASSIIRKEYTMERVMQYIEENDLPLFIEEDLTENTAAFRVMFKLD